MSSVYAAVAPRYEAVRYLGKDPKDGVCFKAISKEGNKTSKRISVALTSEARLR